MARPLQKLQRVFRELKRRNVYKVAATYLVAAFVVLQLADLAAQAFGLPSWFGPMIWVLCGLGFPLALVVAWAFEVTPEGVRRTTGRALEEPAPGTRRRPAMYGGVVVLLALAAGTYFYLGEADAGPNRAFESIAVLPFADLSPDRDQEYFGDGIAEEILNSLSQIDGLLIAARSSSFQFKDENPGAQEVGEALGVDAVLEGSVRKSMDSVRISAQLVSAHDGYLLWSATYDRGLSDIFAVQEEIAGAVVSRVTGRSAEEYRPELTFRTTADHRAYDDFLRGNYHLVKRSPSEVRRAIQAYEDAVRKDPDFAAALARLAYAYGLFVDWGWEYEEATPDELRREGIELTRRALEADSSSADAWMSRAYLLFLGLSPDYAEVLQAFERAIALNPLNAEAFHQYGQTLMVLGCWEEAAGAYRRALSIEPVRAMTMVPLSIIAKYTGRDAASKRWIDSAVAVDPSVGYAHAVRALNQLRAGDVEEALASSEEAIRRDTGYSLPGRAARIQSLYRRGDSSMAREELKGLLQTSDSLAPSPTTARYLASALIEGGGRGPGGPNHRGRPAPRAMATLLRECACLRPDPIRPALPAGGRGGTADRAGVGVLPSPGRPVGGWLASAGRSPNLIPGDLHAAEPEASGGIVIHYRRRRSLA